MEFCVKESAPMRMKISIDPGETLPRYLLTRETPKKAEMVDEFVGAKGIA
jgi:hypothetical protein